MFDIIRFMQAISHKVTHTYQPTSNTCGYTALSILLSSYDISKTPEELVAEVPQPKDSAGTVFGSVTAQLVEWCQRQGLNTHMYTSDCLILDLSWQGLTTEQLIERLEAVRNVREVPAMGKEWCERYIDAYINMLKSGSKLDVVNFIKSKLLYKLLQQGPVFANICSTALRGKGRAISTVENGEHKDVLDDIKGKAGTHSVVIYGNDEDGNYLVADPWDGLVTIDPESMVCAIEAAQIECDNQCFVITK